jgi:hypothetical protein
VHVVLLVLQVRRCAKAAAAKRGAEAALATAQATKEAKTAELAAAKEAQVRLGAVSRVACMR